MLDNDDFYPTPSNLAIKMVNMIDPSFSSRILEPSAGSGNIAEKVKDSHRYRRIDIDCIESDERLRSVLIGKNFNVIDTDFLSYQPTKQYDTIIMNPPFSNGANHLLKAWEILYHGDIICLLNAETIKNPYSKERQLLLNIIDDNGSCEFIENSFSYAERRTNVEVALIKLSKRQSIKSDYFDSMKISNDVDEPELNKNEIAIPSSQIENSVIAYNKAIECKKEAIIKEMEAEYYARMIRKSSDSRSDNEITKDTKESLNEYIDKLRESAWSDIMSMADFRRNLTEKVRKDIDAQMDIIKKLEFTVKNITSFLHKLINDQKSIANNCVLDIFDLLTKYYPENRVHIEGWKSNDVFFVGRRCVLPYMTELGWSGELRVHYNAKEKLRDIERVMKLLMGNTDSPAEIIESHKDLSNIKIETKYADFRFYKKGTMHIYFNKKFIDFLNINVGRQRGWLPESDDKIPEKFWLMNEN